MVNPDRNLYEPPYDDALLYESDLEPERPRSRPLVVLLGIVVLAAFAGVVWVAYNQGVKHGQGGTPILTADSGPTRIPGDAAATADPAPDKSYERLFGDSPEQAETVLPPAEQPRAMAAAEDALPAEQPTDAPGAQGGPQAKLATDIPPPSADPRMDSATGISGPSSLSSGSPRSITSAPPSAGSEDITESLPPVEMTTPPPAAVKPAAPKAVAPAPAKPATAAPTVAMPIVPPPAAVVKTPPVSAPAPVEEEAVSALPPAPEAPAAASSGVMIQLGSFPNDSLAASAWAKIKSSNQALLGDYRPTIKPAEIEGKGTWYRLRVGGFADKAAAANVCEQLKATGQACIIASK